MRRLPAPRTVRGETTADRVDRGSVTVPGLRADRVTVDAPGRDEQLFAVLGVATLGVRGQRFARRARPDVGRQLPRLVVAELEVRHGIPRVMRVRVAQVPDQRTGEE